MLPLLVLQATENVAVNSCRKNVAFCGSGAFGGSVTFADRYRLTQM